MRADPLGPAPRGGSGGRPPPAQRRDAGGGPRARRRDRLGLYGNKRTEVVSMLRLSARRVSAAAGIGGGRSPKGLPGSSAPETLISGAAFWARGGALGGRCICSAVWGLSSRA